MVDLLAEVRQLQELGKIADAIPFEERAVETVEDVLGPDDVALASMLNNLAEVHYNLRNHDAAEPLHLRVLKIRGKDLGPEHERWKGS